MATAYNFYEESLCTHGKTNGGWALSWTLRMKENFMHTDHCFMETILERLPKAHVVCVGDVIMDFFTHGQVSRISPEAPVPVLLETRQTFALGGVGNVVRNLSALGTPCTFISLTGTDPEGQDIETIAKNLPQVDPFLIRCPLRPTSRKTRYLSQGGSQILRVDHEVTTDVPSGFLKQMEQKVRDVLTPSSVLLLSDYGKGILTKDFLKNLMAYARSLGAFIAIDPKGHDYEAYAGASLLTPNVKELSEGVGAPLTNTEEIVAAAHKIITQWNVGAVLVTRSQEGMSLICGQSVPVHIPAKALEVYDVSGAGDTVIASLAAAYGSGASLEEAAHFSNVAAAVVVGKVGTATVTPQEILNAVTLESHSRGPISPESKILECSQAIEQVFLWHRQGCKVGFTNGCFDLLHPGHLKILRESKRWCDRLIVGVNSDSSVRGLKGSSRPISPERARAEILAALQDVDLVVIFHEETPEALIRALKPDLLTKGSDYRGKPIAGGDFVRTYGGEVRFVDVLPGESTSSLVQRMIANTAQEGNRGKKEENAPPTGDVISSQEQYVRGSPPDHPCVLQRMHGQNLQNLKSQKC